MHLIVCIDERYGLSFGGRRLSRDREVITHMLHMTRGSKLWVHPYSADLFPADSVLKDADYLEKADVDDYCFLEKGDIPQTPSSVILYRWNRTYPATEHFPQQILQTMNRASQEEFPGHSHEKITVERYIL